jgi:DNA ligase-1
MQSDAIYYLIETIAQTSSKNDKISTLKNYIGDADFERVMIFAYDPFKTYGIAKIPAFESDADGEFNEQTWALLDRLIARTLTGNAARAELQAELERLTDESGQLLARIIKKDLRANFSESSINKAKKGTIPEFPYMRCCLPKDAKLDAFAWLRSSFSQEKADGLFCNVDHEAGGIVRLTSRQGSPFPIEHFEALANDVITTFAEGTQSHGELLVKRDGRILPREIGNGVLNSVLKGGSFADNESPIYMVWDQIPLSAVKPKGKFDVPYEARFNDLSGQVSNHNPASISVIETRRVKSMDEALAHYRELLAQGKEGTILKCPTAIWRDGTSKHQVKMKLEVDVDLRIIGFLPGEGKNAATFGSVLTQSECGELEVAVSGFTDDARQRIHADRESLLDTIMTVRANSIMFPSGKGKHSLFLPRAVEFRADKSEADSLQRIKDQFEAAIRG